MARGPLFKNRETGLADDISIINLMPFQQPVADQKFDATRANLDRRNHNHASGAALAEASCTDCGWCIRSHITDCYYAYSQGLGQIRRNI